MIDQLKGIVEQKTLTYAVLFVNGVGYKLTMSINGLESLPSKGKEAHILTYLHVREDILNLFGFADEKERNVFHLLISISGIGPKLALTILSGIEPSRLKDRVIAGDVVALTSVPGVGAKTAKRIIVELKEKFMKTSDDSLGFEEEGESVSPHVTVSDSMPCCNKKSALNFSHSSIVVNVSKRDVMFTLSIVSNVQQIPSSNLSL